MGIGQRPIRLRDSNYQALNKIHVQNYQLKSICVHLNPGSQLVCLPMQTRVIFAVDLRVVFVRADRVHVPSALRHFCGNWLLHTFLGLARTIIGRQKVSELWAKFKGPGEVN